MIDKDLDFKEFPQISNDLFLFKEGFWNDALNGVNPKSKKLWFHITIDGKLDGKVFTPRVPPDAKSAIDEEKDKNNPYYENTTIPRVCFSPSIEGCLNALGVNMNCRPSIIGRTFYVYTPEKDLSEYKTISNEEIIKKKYVFDARATGETWIIEPVKLKLYGTIVIDQAQSTSEVYTADKNAIFHKFNYKWHWQMKPRVISDIGHSEFSYESCIKEFSIGAMLPQLGLDGTAMEQKFDHGLYHISTSPNIKTITPSIPTNFLTKSGYEDTKTPRVCFAPSVGHCLTALSQNCQDKEYYVYTPVDKNLSTYKPSLSEVPDSGITGEVWSKEPVDVICVGKILAGKSYGDGLPYKYGNNTAELYRWKYDVISEYVTESAVNLENNISLVPATSKDIPNIYKWELDMMLAGYGNEKVPDDEYKQIDSDAKEDSKKSIPHTRMIQLNGKTIGMIQAHMKDKKWYLGGIYIIEGYRGRGIGESVLQNELQSHPKMELHVYKNNKNALNMYKSLGFKVTREGDWTYTMATESVNEDWCKNLLIEAVNHKPMYFYHMIDKSINLDKKGLKTPDYILNKEHNTDLYSRMTDKYRYRLTHGWNIYPNKNPEDLTVDEIFNGINRFRKSESGNNQIYMFKYPPYSDLGPNMADILKDKVIYAFDINDPNNQKYIKSINWGYDGSHTDNKKLDRNWYENINEIDYFKKYDDNSMPLFATLNHISIEPRNGYIPLSCLKAVDINLLKESVEFIPEKEKKMDSINVGRNKSLTFDNEDWNSLIKHISAKTSDTTISKGSVVYRITNAKEALTTKRKYVTLSKSEAMKYTNPSHGIVDSPTSAKIMTMTAKNDIKIAGTKVLVDVISKIYNQEKFEFKDWKKFSLSTNSDKIFAELIKRGYDGTVDIMDLDFAKSATIIFNPKKSFENPEFQNINEAVEYAPMPNPTQDGFYKPGKKSWYSRVMVNGYSYRERVETLIIDHRFGDRDYVLINFKNDGTYELPGGGSEPNMTLEDSAVRECREEVRIEVSGLLYCGQYALTYDRPGDDYYGVINHVFIGKRAQKYEGHIDLEDRDPDMLQNSKWYEVNTIFNKLRPEHKKAIGLYRSRYITTIPRESNMTHNVDGLLTEGTCPKYKRSELPDEAFGIPQERKYPLHTKKNVISAAKLFNHVENKYEKQLAKAIIKRGKQFDVDFSFVGDKNRLKKYLIKAKLVNERTDNMDMSSVMMAEFFGESSENDSKINDKIEPFVKKIEAKGYEVKYSSPGYANTRFDNDRDKDGVINAKMVTTGRIIFARDYHFDETPQGWTWKVMNNGAKALYVKPYTYNPRMGNEETAFKKWQEFYLSNLADWIERLDNCGKDNKENPEDTNFSK